jgi:AraC-like DNA-binding protein
VLRTLYLAPHHVGSLPTSSGLVVFAPLLRALVVRAFERGTLRDDVATDSRVAALLVDELCSALQQSHEPMDLPLPQDGRALRASELMQQLPGARLAELALVRESGASRRTLERLFVAQTGLTLGEWQQRNALLHGMRCVVDGMNVAQAALAAGYTSPSAFIAAYRRLTGTTPGRAAGTGRNAPRSAADPLGTGTVEHGEPRGLTRTRTAAPDTKKRR